MARITIRPKAEADLEEIWLYLAEQADPERADNVVLMINQKLEMIATHPHMGRLRPDIRHGLRSVVAGRYIAFYVPLDDGVDVVRVVYGGRDLPQVFADE